MERKENKMGVMPVKRLIISMSLPMMVSMLVQALYNVVDSIFVARLSEQALTAVTLAFPLQNLMIAPVIWLIMLYTVLPVDWRSRSNII